jgi:uncharacterized phage protein gp47/JayE
MADIDEFWVPTAEQLVNANLRVRRNGLIQRGVSNPNVTKESDHFVYATALANNLIPAYQNLVIKADQAMPDTAVGEALIRWLDVFGLTPQGAIGAGGNIVFATSTATLVPVDSQLIDDVGQVFRVTVGGTYDDEDEIPVVGVSTGASTNHEAGTVLQWVDQPAFAETTAEVAIGGLTGGADKDNDEASRALLYDHLRNPAGGGNWSQVIKWAKAASASVHSAFVYPALNGPATLGLCLLGELTYDATTKFTREVTEAVRSAVHDYVAAQLDANKHVDLTTQTPKDADGAATNTDIAIGLSLPASTGAGGPGGGWVDAVPWPALLGTATRVSVSVVTDSTHLTLTSNDAATTPSSVGLVDGVTEIAWFSPQAWANDEDCIVKSTVTAHGGVTGALTVTLSEPLAGVAVGDFIFPSCDHAEEYAQAFIAAMANMGPGQWYPNLAVVPQAERQPLVVRQQPSHLVSALLKAIEDTGDEVEDVAYLYRETSAPGVPASTTDSPFTLVPSALGFYDKIP